MNRIYRSLVLAGALGALAAPMAYGHAEVTGLSPKKGSTVPRSLSAVTISFDAAVAGGKLWVRDSDGDKVSRKSKLVNGKKGMRAGLRTLSAGRYTARAKWVADDGDVQRKKWTFRVG